MRSRSGLAAAAIKDSADHSEPASAAYLAPMALIRAERIEADGSSYAGHANPAATVRPPSAVIHSVAAILTGHVLRDGETVLLALRPSRLFVLLHSARFAAGVALALCWLQAAQVHNMRYYIDAGLFAVSARVMWAVLVWMGRLYVLTDQRIVRLAGVFNVELFDCPLRRVSRTSIHRTASEKLLYLGSIEIHPCDASRGSAVWQTIRAPEEVREQIEAAIRKARQGGLAER